MNFAKYVFLISGSIGLLELIPLYFAENMFATHNPPALTHPEFYYGFLCVAIAWQITYFLIGSNPTKYRVIILPAIFSKFGYAITAIVLFSFNRMVSQGLLFAILDIIYGCFFILAYIKTADTSSTNPI